MILIEQAQVPDADLPVAEFREHLQLGSGFADDGFQDAVLVQQLRAAIATVEGRVSKALISRDFLLLVSAWRMLGAQALPIAPVSAVQSLAITDANSNSQTVDATAYRLKRDAHQPEVVSSRLSLPIIPVGGTRAVVLPSTVAEICRRHAPIRLVGARRV